MATHTYQLSISYSISTEFAQNILHYQFDDGGFADTQSAALALVDAFDAHCTTGYKSILPNSTSILSYRGRALNVAGGFEAIKLLAGPPAGTRAGNLQVTGVCPVLIFFPNGNAKQRGRMFLPGVTDLDLIDGDFQVGFRGQVSAVRHLFSDTLTLTGGGAPVASPVVYSRLPLPSTSRIIEYVRLSDMPGTLRRRQRPA
jgi:hypothetical protein